MPILYYLDPLIPHPAACHDRVARFLIVTVKKSLCYPFRSWPKLKNARNKQPIWHTANWATKIAASIAASILVVSTSPALSDKRLAATPSAKRFAGRTVTIALPSAIKTGLGNVQERLGKRNRGEAEGDRFGLKLPTNISEFPSAIPGRPRARLICCVCGRKGESGHTEVARSSGSMAALSRVISRCGNF
jgi:hypothetical protein